MATEIDIAVTTTTYDVTITAEPNEYIVNITTNAGGGGVQSVTGTTVDNTDALNPIVEVPTLQQVTDEGATTTNQIVSEQGVQGAEITALDGNNRIALIPNQLLVQFQKDAFQSDISANDLDGNYLWTLPNQSGTIALTSDIGGASWGAITGTLSDQTDLQTALDSKVDENTAITGATKTKITYDAKGLVTAGADATTADIADSTNKRYVTDAQQTVIGNTSGTNTGDNATNTTSNAYADAKVTDAIVNGVTTVAPSQNAVFDALALKTDNTDWIDYSNISTIVGFSSFIAKFIFYKIIDDIMFVNFSLQGTSNSTALTFTLPNSAVNSLISVHTYVVNNGIASTGAGRIIVSGNTVTCTINGQGGAYTASNGKASVGEFFIQI